MGDIGEGWGHSPTDQNFLDSMLWKNCQIVGAENDCLCFCAQIHYEYRYYALPPERDPSLLKHISLNIITYIFLYGNFSSGWFLIFAGFEIYLCDADPMVSPALYNSRNTGLLDKSEDKPETKSRPDFVQNQGDFPQLGEKPVSKDGHTVIVHFLRLLQQKIQKTIQ